MAEVKGFEELARQLQGRSIKGKKTVTYTVAYAAPYAIYVHENLEARHPIGQAKFLEQPLREYKSEIEGIISRAIKAKHNLGDAVYRAAKFILAKSQELVPVLTGVLKESGYVEEESVIVTQ